MREIKGFCFTSVSATVCFCPPTDRDALKERVKQKVVFVMQKENTGNESSLYAISGKER